MDFVIIPNNDETFSFLSFSVPMESMGLGSTASTVQNLAKNFHYSQFQLSEIAAKGTC